MKKTSLIRNLALLVPLLGASLLAEASHFRFGSITYRTEGTGNITARIKMTQSFRSGSFFGTPALGDLVNVGSDGRINFGDGSSENAELTVTTVGPDYFVGEATVVHTYATAGTYEVSNSNCCRISTLRNNADEDWYISTQVAAGSTNSSPVSSLSPIVVLPTGQATASYQIPASDPENNPLVFTAATSADLGGISFTNAPGLVVSPTGLVSFSTVGRATGQLFNAVVKVSDGTTSIILDHIIQIGGVASNNAPVFTAPTPANASVIIANPGVPVTFTVRATDADAGDVVTLNSVGSPVGATTTPALPTTGNPVQAVFSFTPTASQLGDFVVNFTAQDASSAFSSTSVTIRVQNPTVTCNNNANTPVAGTDQFTAACGSITITAAQLLANDTSPNGTPLAIGSVSGGAGGNVVDNGDGTFTFTPFANYNGPVFFTYLLQAAGPIFPNPATGRYYELVDADDICWDAAKTAAAGMSYAGMTGYLATLTSFPEANYLAGRKPGNYWIGGSDETTEGVWMWKTGPEMGQTFYIGNGTTGGATAPGAFSNWSPGEPNDYSNMWRPGGEDYAHIYGGSALWNDLSNCAGGSRAAGYVVEYGGLPGECQPVLYATGTANINVTNSGTGTSSITAVADNFSTSAGTPLTITSAQLVGNDTDTQGRVLRAGLVTDPDNGAIVNNNDGTYTFTPAPGFQGTATFTYVSQLNGPATASPATGHYYEFVDGNVCWDAAKLNASGMSYNGLQGYLATITSADETAVVNGVKVGNYWIGASDEDVEGEWRWKTGPEAGQLFYVGNGSTGGSTVPGMYSNWSQGEPNDFSNQFRPGGEDYGHIYGTSGFWNDLSNCAGGAVAGGYIVEYGGLEQCTPTLFAVGTVTVNVGTAPAVRGTNSLVADGTKAVLEVAPNPTSGAFSVRVKSATDGAAQLDLYNLQGRKVQGLFTGSVQAGEVREVRVEAGELASGLYLVRLQTAQGVQNLRVVVQK